MDKFGRNYILSIDPRGGGTPIIIQPPFTLEFDITRNTLSSANVCQVRIYNLSLLNRNLIRRNAFDYSYPFQAIELKAGYRNNLATIFSGNISQAWSVREGVNFITQIECYDGGFAYINGTTSMSFPANTPREVIIKSIMANGLPFTTPGAVGSYPGSTARGNSYTGNTAKLLDELTGGGFFVDLGKANALGTDEYIASAGGVTVISPQTGLLNTPVLEYTLARFDMIFEPSLNVGRIVRIESTTENNFNGSYKITAVKHRGMISEAVCGAVITTGEFSYLKAPTPVM